MTGENDPDSSDLERELFQRIDERCKQFGLQAGDYVGLSFKLLAQHDRVFQRILKAWAVSEIENPNRLLVAAHQRQKRGRKRITHYERMLPAAIQFYRDKKSKNSRMNDVKIAELFLNQTARERESHYREGVDEAIADAADELRMTPDDPELRAYRERRLAAYQNPFANLSAETLAKEISRALGKRKNSD